MVRKGARILDYRVIPVAIGLLFGICISPSAQESLYHKYGGHVFYEGSALANAPSVTNIMWKDTRFDQKQSLVGVGIVLDAPPSTVKFDASQTSYTVFITDYGGIDRYESSDPGSTVYPFGIWIGSAGLGSLASPIAPYLGSTVASQWMTTGGTGTNYVWNAPGFPLPNNGSDFKDFNPVWAWIANMYYITQNDINNYYLQTVLSSINPGVVLGFVHVERQEMANSYSKTLYTIGLGISYDQGIHWAYLGDIIHPFYEYGMSLIGCKETNGSACKNSSGISGGYVLHNIGGVPYIVVPHIVVPPVPKPSEWNSRYFYVYFNEYTGDNARYEYQEELVSVARASVKDVLINALKGLNTPFYKYLGTDGTGNEKWDEYSANTPAAYLDNTRQAGASVIPPAASGPFVDQGDPTNDGDGKGDGVCGDPTSFLMYDTQSDAAFCEGDGAYLMTIHTYEGRLLLFHSTAANNGVDWDLTPWVVFRDCWKPPTNHQPHSFFLGADGKSDPSMDCHVVGNDFYIFWDGIHQDPAPTVINSLVGVELNAANLMRIRKIPRPSMVSKK